VDRVETSSRVAAGGYTMRVLACPSGLLSLQLMEGQFRVVRGCYRQKGRPRSQSSKSLPLQEAGRSAKRWSIRHR
jgi:hypothetical protein